MVTSFPGCGDEASAQSEECPRGHVCRSTGGGCSFATLDGTTSDDDDDGVEVTASDSDNATAPTGDTGPPPEEPVINAFGFQALFAVDRATGTVAGATDTTDPAHPVVVRPAFQYNFYRYRADDNALDPSQSCDLTVFLEGATAAPWAAGDPDVYFAVDAEPIDIETNCDPATFHEDLTGILDVLTTEPIGVGIGALTAEMIEAFHQFDETPDDLTIGGSYRVEFFDPTEVREVYGQAYALDASLTTRTTPDDDGDGLDELVPLLAADIVPATDGVPTALYQTQSYYIYVVY